MSKNPVFATVFLISRIGGPLLAGKPRATTPRIFTLLQACPGTVYAYEQTVSIVRWADRLLDGSGTSIAGSN